MKRHIVWTMLMISLAALLDCAPKPVKAPDEKPVERPVTAQPPLKRLTPAEYPWFSDTNQYERLAEGIGQSLAYLKRLPPMRQISFGRDRYTVSHLMESLVTFSNIIATRPKALRLNQLIAEQFEVYVAAGGEKSGKVLFTGYYEPMLHGSLTRTPDYPVAIHSRPADLVEIDLSTFAPDLAGRRIIGQYKDRKIIPYPVSDQIRRKKDFDRIAPPIAWLRDEIDLFNLMVQGSGKVRLENGETLQIGFDTSNGQPYRSIGRLLIDQGKISAARMSMQAIREYLLSHPDEAMAIMSHNPRYIFFRRIDAGGPVGSLGVPLTPLRSIAVDHKCFPSAALAFISLPVPVVNNRNKIENWAPMSGFALAQDAGSAIKGAGRVDLFWGYGDHAETAAGNLKHRGQLYFLVLKPVKRLAK